MSFLYILNGLSDRESLKWFTFFALEVWISKTRNQDVWNNDWGTPTDTFQTMYNDIFVGFNCLIDKIVGLPKEEEYRLNVIVFHVKLFHSIDTFDIDVSEDSTWEYVLDLFIFDKFQILCYFQTAKV